MFIHPVKIVATQNGQSYESHTMVMRENGVKTLIPVKPHASMI